MNFPKLNKEKINTQIKSIRKNLFNKNDNSHFIDEIRSEKIDYINLLFIFIILFTLLFYFLSTFFSMKYNNVDFFRFKNVYKAYNSSDYILNLEKDFNENFHNRLNLIENYGGLKKLLGKKFVDDPLVERYVYKGKNGFLYYVEPNKIDTKKIAKKISAFQDKLITEHTTFVTCLAPNKHAIASENFPYGVLDYTTHNTSDLEKNLNELGVSSLNLSTIFYKEELDENTSFFANDTHWRFETAFWGYTKLIDYFKNAYMMPIKINKATHIENYKLQKYSDIYIGSMGKRAGKKYVDSKDDINILLPNFETDFVYKKYDENYNLQLEKRGTYKDCFLNEQVLESNDEYSDKYISLMGYGSPYEVIENKKLDDDSKLVIIKDSFAMPVASYLANNFSKIYLVDTRYKNIKNTLDRTIHIIDPDVVLLFVSPTSMTFFPELFDIS